MIVQNEKKVLRVPNWDLGLGCLINDFSNYFREAKVESFAKDLIMLLLLFPFLYVVSSSFPLLLNNVIAI